METNNHKIVDYDEVLDAEFGKEGTPERAKAEEEAYAFYTSQILQDARKEAKVSFDQVVHIAHRERAGDAQCGHVLPYYECTGHADRNLETYYVRKRRKI